MNVDFDPSDVRPLYPNSDRTADIARRRLRAQKQTPRWLGNRDASLF
jgi:hypothetical protein